MVSVLVVSIIIGTQLAYVLNRFKFPGNGLIRNLFLFASLLPAVAMQVTVYNIMTALHFLNHLYGLYYSDVRNGCYLNLHFHSVYGKYTNISG